MSMRQKMLQVGIQAAKRFAVASLCALMTAGPGTPAWAAKSDEAMTPKPARTAPLTAQERTLHVLNRLTFGPRPGDEAALQKMGFEPWLERQLHPETIDDSAFEHRLDLFPAMKLSQQELESRFPSQQIIRQMSQNDGSLPNDPVLHAIYADAEAAYELNQKRVGAGLQPIGAPPVNGQDPAMQAQDPNAQKMDAGANEMDGQAMQSATPARVAGRNGNKTNAKFAEPSMAADEVKAVLTLQADARMQKV
jgi:hypothetical protein